MATKPKHRPLLPKLFILILLFWLLLFLFFTSHPSHSKIAKPAQCNYNPPIAPFYIHTLPSDFNDRLLQHCESLNIYTDMCPHVANRGLGRPLNATWHATHQFIAEMIFHARAENHPCRTLDPADAELFYVPFYAGLYASSVFGEKDFGVRDRLGVEVMDYVVGRDGWTKMNGADHFMVIGRTAWDFMRSDGDEVDFGANRLLRLPSAQNMTILTVERHPWQGHNQHGIPYPSYFHPLTTTEMLTWQSSVQRSPRTHLFSFVGGPRVNVEKAAVRNKILDQCAKSDNCIRVQCTPGSVDCHEPDRVLDVMKRSKFCMQPPGDSFTRRSTFDSILSGCIPVFFSEHTAYTQYAWFLPAERKKWSVFIEPDRWDFIEEELNKISDEEVKMMRKNIIELIPRVTYVHPNASFSDMDMDAVDIALAQLTMRIRSLTSV